MSKRDEKLVLWPVYFDIEENRPWRRVPRELAVYAPSADEIARAAQELRLHPVLERGVAHPQQWWDKRGRVLVDIRGSKSVLVRQIAERLRAMADAKAGGEKPPRSRA